MGAHPKLETLGSFLFRWRSYSVVLYIPLFMLFMHEYEIPFRSNLSATLFTIFSFVFVLLGALMRFGITGCVAPGNSGRNVRRQRADSLQICGFYSIVRNPLYVANFMIVTGVVLLVQSAWFLLAHLFIFLLFYLPIILKEEDFLRGKFHDAFAAYKKRVPRLIPNPFLWKSEKRSWNWRKALRREQDTLFATFLCFSLGNYLLLSLEMDKLLLNLPFFTTLTVVSVLWFTLKMLKKFTTVLRD
jgi:protein-S-isoprenylcysteine O-methyltransferase Ste14